MKQLLRKSVVLAALCLVAGIMQAQDIIVTNKAEKIEGKILEVSTTEIRYKRLNFEDGPVFVLPIKDIHTVIYSNGEVQIFSPDGSGQPAEQHHQSQQPEPAPTQQPAASGVEVLRETPTQVTIRMPKQKPAETVYLIEKDGGRYYMGDLAMSEEEYLSYIKLNCPAAWESYREGTATWATGWALFGVGAACHMFAFGCYTGGVIGRFGSPVNTAGMVNAGRWLNLTGGVLWAASVPCLIVGGVRRNNSHEVYNALCRRRIVQQQYSMEFGIQPAQGGMGLAMKF